MLGAGLLQWVMTSISFARHQFPPDVIRHAVWLYLRFTLSYRDVEDMLAERGLDLTYETVRRWVTKFGPLFAKELRKRRPRPTSRWHLDEIKIAGKRNWLWRAVDEEGEVLDILVQSRRDTKAAVRLMRKLIRKQGFAPEVLVTDRLGSYGAAKRKLGLLARHEQGLRKNNRAENSHQPTPGASARCSASSHRDRPSAFVRPCCRPQHVQHPAPPRFPPHPPPLPGRGGHYVGGGHGLVSFGGEYARLPLTFSSRDSAHPTSELLHPLGNYPCSTHYI